VEIDKNGQHWDSDMDRDFPVKIWRHEYQKVGPMFESHWHEEFQMQYFVQGCALIRCNSRPVQVGPGEVVVINGNDLHYGENLAPNLVYYSVKVDLSFLLSSQPDLCQTKYMNPLLQNQIVFQNHIPRDEELGEEMRRLIAEYERREMGYEMAVKACIYRILVLLLRRYRARAADEAMQERQNKALHILRPILEYVDRHYQEKLSLGQLAAMANMSRHHFCRLFKKVTGKPPIEYLNCLRLNKAGKLLAESDRSISEIAAMVGFDDSNYFSRLFKKYMQASPSKLRAS